MHCGLWKGVSFTSNAPNHGRSCRLKCNAVLEDFATSTLPSSLCLTIQPLGSNRSAFIPSPWTILHTQCYLSSENHNHWRLVDVPDSCLLRYLSGTMVPISFHYYTFRLPVDRPLQYEMYSLFCSSVDTLSIPHPMLYGDSPSDMIYLCLFSIDLTPSE